MVFLLLFVKNFYGDENAGDGDLVRAFLVVDVHCDVHFHLGEEGFDLERARVLVQVTLAQAPFCLAALDVVIYGRRRVADVHLATVRNHDLLEKAVDPPEDASCGVLHACWEREVTRSVVSASNAQLKIE